MEIFKDSNEFKIGSKIIIKAVNDEIQLYYRNLKFIPREDDQNTYEFIEELYINKFFEQLNQKDIKYFLNQTNMKYLVEDFLVSKIGEIVSTDSKLSIYHSHELIDILWILSKFTKCYYLLHKLSIHKKKLNQMLSNPQESIELTISAILVNYISFYRNRTRVDKILDIFKEFENDLVYLLPKLLIFEYPEEVRLEIHSGVVEVLSKISYNSKEHLKSSLSWVIENYDYSDFFTPKGGCANFISPLLKYLPTNRVINYLDSFYSDQLIELTFDVDFLFTHDLISRLFKGMNYTNTQIKKQARSVIKKLGGSLLVGLAYNLIEGDNLNKNAIEAFSLISDLPIDLLENFVFKLGLMEDEIIELFHKDNFFPHFNPRLESKEVILNKCYWLLCKEIDSSLSDFEINI
ncbi:MAG: hypothetical protein ACFFDF_15540 [Candidatus Odinarchaeota archaeon]